MEGSPYIKYHAPQVSEYQPQPLPRRTKPRQWIKSFRSADWWMFEILSLIVSAGALLAIFFLLASLQDKPQPSWASGGNQCVEGNDTVLCRTVGISVNAVISWLGTIARICLLVPVSNGIGQLKWSWFNGRAGYVKDMGTFDEASRGILGSLRLIWRLKARYAATLGALGMIFSVAFDPFVQNLVGYYSKPVLDVSQTPFVASNQVYDVPILSYNNYLVADPSIKAAVYTAFYSADTQKIWAQPHHVCNTGNCTWNPIPSVAICAVCEDTTSQVAKPAHQAHGRYFTMSSTGGKADTLPRQISSIYLKIDAKAAAKFLEWDEEPEFTSSNCTLKPCVQSVKSEFLQNRPDASPPYRETLVKTWLSPGSKLVDSTSYAMSFPDDPEHGLQSNEIFGFNGSSASGLFNTISDTFDGYYEMGGIASQVFSRAGGLPASDAVSAIWNGNFTGCEHPENRVSCAVELVTKAMSKTIRDTPFNANGTLGTAGKAYSPVLHVHVTWYWISLPVFVWGMALVTFLATVWKSSAPGINVWRNSVLPLVFMKVMSEEERIGANGAAMRELEKRAGGLKGVVSVAGKEVRFVA
ncbi:hypothetical protein BCR34DRAFT_485302 [Clohesyomyces aquaticus]|uniref:Uncharacterized protein n=1 Tax=Clohesyomyces aquaticus TaxID=1231657 RepID=A0A1Y1ZK54_9PLEO|nr:hypothetical protein BCR34DRAFT_485302 [Clohesyomyces aquaticus]